MIHWGLSSRYTEIQRWLYKGIMGIRTPDTLMCTYIYIPTQVHMLSLPCPWEPRTKLAKLLARAALNDWSNYMLHSSRHRFHRLQNEFHRPPSPEVVQCSGPWRKLDIILKTRRSLLQSKQIQCLGWNFNRAQQDYLLAVQLDPKLGSQHTHTHIHTHCTSCTSFFLSPRLTCRSFPSTPLYHRWMGKCHNTVEVES